MENNEALENKEYRKLQKKINILRLFVIILIILIIFMLEVVNIYYDDDSGALGIGTEEIWTFNAQFIYYTGTGVSSTNVYALINAVNANNILEDRKVEIELDGLEEGIEYTGTVSEEYGYTIYNYRFFSQWTYNITAEYDEDGYVNKMIITKSE